MERPWLKWDVKDQNKTNCSSPAVIYMEEPASSELLPTSDRSSNLYSYISVTQILMERLFQKPSSMLRFICNNEEVKPIKSSSNKMVIEFQSGPPSADYVNKEVRGFKLNFTIAEKGGEIADVTNFNCRSSHGIIRLFFSLAFQRFTHLLAIVLQVALIR